MAQQSSGEFASAQPDDESARCKGSRASDRRKDFSQCMRWPTTPSTSSAISPQQERIEPLGHRRCRRGAKPLLRQDLLRVPFADVTKPVIRMQLQEQAPCISNL